MFGLLRHTGKRLAAIEANQTSIMASLARIEGRQAATRTEILLKLEPIMPALDNLKANVANDTTVDQSAITLLTGLKSALDAAIASNDPTQIQALSDQLGANQTALAAAIAANTPAAAPAPAAGS